MTIPPELADLAVPIASLREHPRNARRGDVGLIADSLKAHGQYRPVVVNRRTMQVLGGNHTLKAAVALGWDDIAATFIDVDDEEALRIMLVDNRANDVADYEDTALANILTDLAATADQLLGTGYDGDDLDTLLADIERSSLDPDSATERMRGHRRLPLIDLYMTLNAGTQTVEHQTTAPYPIVLCCMAVKAGWRYGMMSSYRACRNAADWPPHKVDFVDNEFKNYDHARHLEVVEHFKPKYATIRDVMTQEQCNEVGAEFMELGHILDLATELEEAGAENVIVIPKYDCLDDIPERFVAGYSVPTSYGGTPLPTEAFKGRRVHLLGGSPSRQIAYFDQLPDEVVSLDNNYILKVAKFGTYWTSDDPSRQLDDVGLGPGETTSTVYNAFQLSVGSFAKFFARDEAEDAAVMEAEERV